MSLTAEKVLDRVAEAYASCGSYRDWGRSFRRFVPEHLDAYEDSVEFETVFIGPDLYRFDARENSRSGQRDHVVWQVGRRIRSWSSPSGRLQEYEALEFGAHARIGGAHHVTIYAPHLLIAQDGRDRLDRSFPRLKYVGEEVREGSPCHRLESSGASGPLAWQRLWVCVETEAILEIEQRLEWTAEDNRQSWKEATAYARQRAREDLIAEQIFRLMSSSAIEPRGHACEQRITYSPEFEPSIDRGHFHFEPPDSGGDQPSACHL